MTLSASEAAALDEALTLMSLAVDFAVTQVADGNFGAHATIAKAMFEGRPPRPTSR